MSFAGKHPLCLFVTLLLVFLLAASGSAFSEGYRIDSGKRAVLNQSMQVRSGPGTSYSGSGSRLESGTEISVLTSARDGSGSPWIQVEFPSQGNRKRGYVPAGCLSIDPGSLPGENTLGQYTVTQDCNGRFGPGQDYASQRVSVTSGTVVTVFAFENGYALVEFQANGDLVRTWIPRSRL